MKCPERRVEKVQDRLAAARDRYWKWRQKRHNAKPGGDRRKRLAKRQRLAEKRKKALAKRHHILRKCLERKQRNAGRLDPDGDGLAAIDGKLVPTPIARDIREAQRRGLLPKSGVVISGWRSPAYSIQLCISICGSPTCPGRCAGASSRHAQKGREGAVDVRLGLQGQFAAAMRTIGSGLKNTIGPSDPNHFSYYGN